MFIHFAFGQLGKKGLVREQTDLVLTHILGGRRLKVSRCTEFLPGLNPVGGKTIPMTRFAPHPEGMSATLDLNEIENLPDAPRISFVQVAVPMICFIKMSYKQLSRSAHHLEYGQFGIVLTDTFLRKNGLQEVQYYTDTSVLSDPLVQEWNRATDSRGAPASLKRDLERRLLAFRKPATMFDALKTVQATVTRSDDQTTVQFSTYSRYPDGYDFRQEREWRPAFQEDAEYLSFREEDLFMVITPDELAKEAVTTHIRADGWRYPPLVNVFPHA